MSRICIQATWSDVPHLSEEQKAAMMDALPPHQRDARMNGIPQLGSGAIYPVPESEIIIDPFQIPDWMPQCYALDVGWNRTAVLWGAYDADADIVYLYAEHYKGQAEPFEHAQAIRARGAWIPGVIDPAARGRGQKDGERLLQIYQEILPDLTLANNAVEAGIYDVWVRFSTGRLKVFKTCQNFIREYRLYRRDEKGHIVKENDHLMDCFHGDTLVWTKEGKRRIADLVGTTGEVITIDGRIAPYHSCQVYGRNRRVVRLTFSDGSSVVCTPDHLFLSGGEWVQAIDLLGRNCDTAVSRSVGERTWSESPSFRRQFRNLRETAITSAASIFRGRSAESTPSGFMLKFGKGRTVAAFLRAITSITWTKTDRTISPATSNSRRRKSIYPNISLGMIAAFRRLRLKLPQPGTVVMRVVSGIANITRNLQNSCIETLRCNAIIARSALSAASLGAIDSAPITAKRNRGKLLGWITRTDSASSAERHSSSTSTSRNKHAAASAQLSCLAIEEAGTADVYCLTVPETSAFAVGGGVIAHNCVRYLVASGLNIACVRPPEKWKLLGNQSRHESSHDPYADAWKI